MLFLLGYSYIDICKHNENINRFLFLFLDELKAVFESFFFEVEVAKDLTREKIEKKLLDVAARDHKNYDCFVCCLLSHGVSDAVCGVDGVELSYESLILPFKTNQCHGLTGKPKLFFIQACQGKNPQMGVKNAGKFRLFLIYDYMFTPHHNLKII